MRKAVTILALVVLLGSMLNFFLIPARMVEKIARYFSNRNAVIAVHTDAILDNPFIDMRPSSQDTKNNTVLAKALGLLKSLRSKINTKANSPITHDAMINLNGLVQKIIGKHMVVDASSASDV